MSSAFLAPGVSQSDLDDPEVTERCPTADEIPFKVLTEIDAEFCGDAASSLDEWASCPRQSAAKAIEILNDLIAKRDRFRANEIESRYARRVLDGVAL